MLEFLSHCGKCFPIQGHYFLSVMLTRSIAAILEEPKKKINCEL